MRMKPVRRGEHHFVEKKWGDETWLDNSDLYCGKILRFKKGHHTSLHFHYKKTETMFCADGRFRIRMLDTENGEEYWIELNPGDTLLIQPTQPHEIWGMGDNNILIEFSTEHFDEDSYRLGQPG